MNKDKEVQLVVLCVMLGLIIGSIMALLVMIGVIPEVNLVYGICLTGIVAVVNGLCILSIIQSVIKRKIEREGCDTEAIIVDVFSCVNPNEFSENEWGQHARYVLTVSYEVGGKKFKKEYPPTALVSKQEIYPQLLEKGAPINIKYLSKHPECSIINVAKFRNRISNEQNNSKGFATGIMIMSTVIYVLLMCIL